MREALLPSPPHGPSGDYWHVVSPSCDTRTRALGWHGRRVAVHPGSGMMTRRKYSIRLQPQLAVINNVPPEIHSFNHSGNVKISHVIWNLKRQRKWANQETCWTGRHSYAGITVTYSYSEGNLILSVTKLFGSFLSAAIRIRSNAHLTRSWNLPKPTKSPISHFNLNELG